MILAPFRLVKIAELDEVETGYLQNAPDEGARQAFARGAHTAVADVRAAFMFELPDYPIAWAYQAWIASHPNSIEDVGINIISRAVFIKERGEAGLHKALTSMVQRGRPEHCVWLLYDQASQTRETPANQQDFPTAGDEPGDPTGR